MVFMNIKAAAELFVAVLALAGTAEPKPVQEDENDVGFWLPSCPDHIPDWMAG